VCVALEWTDAQGRAKLMSCRLALLRLHRVGVIVPAAPTRSNGNGRALAREAALPEARPVSGSVEQLGALELESGADATWCATTRSRPSVSASTASW